MFGATPVSSFGLPIGHQVEKKTKTTKAGAQLEAFRKNPAQGAIVARLSFLQVPVVPAPPPPAPAKRLPAPVAKPLPPPSSPLSSPRNTAPPPSTLWTEIFRFNRSQDMMGNQKMLTILRKWVEFRLPRGAYNKKFPLVAFLSGPAGTGKTTLASVLLREGGANVVEVNASNLRTKDAILDKIRSTCFRRALTKNHAPAALILDEIDGTILDDKNQGAIDAVNEILVEAGSEGQGISPIICICNDKSDKKIRALEKVSLSARFYKLQDYTLKSLAQRVIKKMHLSIAPGMLDPIIKSAQGDARRLINLLYLRPRSMGALNQHSSDLFSDLFNGMKTVFRGKLPLPLLAQICSQETSAMVLLCHENYVKGKPETLEPWSALLSDIDVLEHGWDGMSWSPQEYADVLMPLQARQLPADMDVSWTTFFEHRSAYDKALLDNSTARTEARLATAWTNECKENLRQGLPMPPPLPRTPPVTFSAVDKFLIDCERVRRRDCSIMTAAPTL